ncbi:MAG: carbohydrate binding domain-containing protein [Candidatus Omnitrophota bacterium]
MFKKFFWSLVVIILLVGIGFTLYSCAPKKESATKPEEKKEEAKVVVSETAEKEEAKQEIEVTGELVKPKLKLTREGALIAADFDTCKKPNNLGGGFGAWNKDPNDFTQGCFDSFVSTIKRGDEGCSIQLMYDVDSPNPAYNGFWMRLQGIDLSDYKALSFWVKGDEVRGFTKVFKVELKNTKGQMGRYYVTEVTKDWKEIVIPLDKFAGLEDRTSMHEFVIVFEDRIATKKEGAIYIDDIVFLK